MKTLFLLAATSLTACGGAAEGEAPHSSPPAADAATAPPTNDAGVSAADAPPVNTAPCDLTKPFGPPRKMAVSDPMLIESSPRLSADGLSLYFARGSTTSDLFVARRATIHDAFSGATPVASVNGPTSDEGSPAVTGDGLTLFLESTVGEPGPLSRLHRVTRADVSQPFPALSAETKISLLSSSYPTEEIDPYVAADGSTLMFASNRTGTFNLYEARRAGGDFEPPYFIGKILTTRTFGARAPVLLADKVTLFFSVRASGSATYQVWQARRATPTDTEFTGAKQVTELAAQNQNVLAGDVSRDGCTIYLARADDLYEATRAQ